MDTFVIIKCHITRKDKNDWRKEGTIPYIRIGKKLFYRWQEIIKKIG